MVYAEIVRSPIAHGRLAGCEVDRARAIEGVVDLITHGVAAGMRLPCVTVAPEQVMTSYGVLDDEIRYVGQPVALVVAETAWIARDAADAVDLRFETLPAVIGVESALRSRTTIVSDFELGDGTADCEDGIAQATHVVDMTFQFGRASPYPLETRAVVAAYAAKELTVWISSQAPHHIRDQVADALGLSYDRVRVIAYETGGGFGAKEHLYPDEVLVCLAAVRLGRPVSWTESPTDRLVATLPARAALHRGRLALDADGRFVALHADIVGDIGGHPSNAGVSPFAVSATMLPGPYRFERSGARVRGVLTTTTPTGSYRGFGQPEAAWTRERLIDEAARRLDIDPVELRLRNMIGPDELPCVSRTEQPYDTGDYRLALRTLRELVAIPVRSDGRRRGVGFSCHVQATGMGPSADMKSMGMQAGGFETAIVRMEPDASVIVLAGVVGIGQGIETTLAQIAADRVGVHLGRVRVVLGDTLVTPYSPIGSVASRSMVVSGGAVTRAATQLRTRILSIAGHQLEVDPGDLEVVDSAVRVKGTPEAYKTLRDIATSAWRGWDLPDGSPIGLEERSTYDPATFTFAYGAHAAAVAVDPETGMVEVESYWVVNDSGVLVNPSIVEGQLRGGVAQGIGMALTEEINYTDDGQPQAEYLIPTACEVPNIQIVLLQTPSSHTPGGMKGVGEAGAIGPPAAIGNAIAAAVPEIADRITRTPLTPYVVWSSLND